MYNTNINQSAQNPSLKYINSCISNINCPICGYKEGKLLYTVTVQTAAQNFILKEVDEVKHNKLTNHIDKLWGQSNCNLIRCDACSFVFANPYVAGDAIFYNLAYERTGYPKWKWEYQKTVDKITEINFKTDTYKSSFNLIEIGAGDGAFVRKISPQLIPKENILCLEFSEFGRNNIENYGIKCLSEDVRSLSPLNYATKFDIICMFQVLEHMDRLEELFNQLNALSSVNAHLFIAVPNANQIEFNETYGCVLDIPPNHIGRWNLKSFQTIGNSFGWTVTEHLYEPLNIKVFLREQIAYRYLKVCQDPSSIANKIECLKNTLLRKLLRNIFAGIYTLPRLKSLYQVISKSNQGGSQWVHLTKNN